MNGAARLFHEVFLYIAVTARTDPGPVAVFRVTGEQTFVEFA
jgi:hypothetical protein